MADKYLPLKLLDIEDDIIRDCGKDKDNMEKRGFPKTKDDAEYIDKLLRLFSGLCDENEAYRLLSVLMNSYGETMQLMGMLNFDDFNASKGLLCDIYDLCLRSTIYQIWKKNKQVYKPDKDFVNALIRTENLKITKDIFKRLPCNHFYLDVSDCDIFLPIKGIFVNIFEIETKIILVAYMVNEEAFWSTYDVMHFDQAEEYEMKVEDFSRSNPDGSYTYCNYDIFLHNKKPKENNGGLNSNESNFFIYQLLTYLTSHEPQFEESPVTKSTYRPPKAGSTIKNKFSEIQMHDIGVRFGTSFRKQKRIYNCTTILTKHQEKKRKSPIPHFRAAHWQGYWIGKGRTQLVHKWKEPTFVNGEPKDIVIHKI